MLRTGPISAETLHALLTELTTSRETDLELVAMDCWEPFKSAVREALVEVLQGIDFAEEADELRDRSEAHRESECPPSLTRDPTLVPLSCSRPSPGSTATPDQLTELDQLCRSGRLYEVER